MISNYIYNKEIKDYLFWCNRLMVDICINYPQIICTPYDYGKAYFNRHFQIQSWSLYQYSRTKLYAEAIKDFNYRMENGYPFNNYQVLQTYKVTYNEYPIISLYSEIYEYSGGAHGLTTLKGHTIDIKNGLHLTLNDLFVDDYDYSKTILTYIETEAIRRQEEDDIMYFDDLSENIIKYYDEKNFYLTNKGVAIFYPLYTIAPYATGIQIFEVPYELFGDNIHLYNLGIENL